MWCYLVLSHFLIWSRKPIGSTLGSSCLKSGTGKTSSFVIFMIWDQSTYTYLHHNTPFYAFISHILTFFIFPVFSWLGSGISGFTFLFNRVPTAQGKHGKWQKKSLSRKTQGIWKFCQNNRENTENLVCSSCKFPRSKGKGYCDICHVYVIVRNHVNWYRGQGKHREFEKAI